MAILWLLVLAGGCGPDRDARSPACNDRAEMQGRKSALDRYPAIPPTGAAGMRAVARMLKAKYQFCREPYKRGKTGAARDRYAFPTALVYQIRGVGGAFPRRRVGDEASGG
jgi:hypothetical protein